MARMLYYATTAIILTFLLTIVGQSGADDEGLFSKIGLNGKWLTDSGQINLGKTNTFWVIALATLATVGLVGAIAASFWTSARLENYIVLPFFTGTLLIFLAAFAKIVFVSTHFPDYLRLPMLLLGVIFSVGYCMSLVEYFRGNI